MATEWNQAIQNYLGGERARIQEALEAKEAGEQSKSELAEAKTAQDIGMAGGSFADKLSEEANKLQADMLTDVSAAGLAPTVLKAGARLATARAGQLQSQWKTTQARRFAQQEGLDPDEAAPEAEGTWRGAANEAVDALRQNVGGAIEDAAGRAGQFVRGVVDQARSSLQRDPMPIREPAEEGPEEFHFQNPVFEEPEMADPSTMGVELEPGAMGNATRVGQMLRSIRGAPAGSTSVNMGDAINQARQAAGMPREEVGMFGGGRGGPVPGKAPPGRAQGDLLEGDPEVAPGPGEAIPGMEADAAAQANEDAARVGGQVDDLAGQAEREASAAAEDLAPELTSAAEGWSSLAGALGDAIPIVGFGLGAWALGQGISDEVKSMKDKMSDPYAAVRGEIAQTQGKINTLENTISADQFSSKLGAGTPAFGSLAARPTLDTSQMTGVALHV